MLVYSISELIDKLCIVHLKLWHAEEEIERIKTKEPNNIEDIEPLLNQVVSLNKLRTKIVASIEDFLKNKES